MKTLSRVACGAALALVITAAAQADPLQPVRVTPDELTWKPNPAGNQQAMLAGDPQKAGVYAFRVRFQAGFRNQPRGQSLERLLRWCGSTPTTPSSCR